jgi:MFS family permease
VNKTTNGTHRWRFFRSGGFDQVALDSGADLLHLATLDPKLWTALSCPTSGLEFDARTLALLDTDGDGQIRVPEIVAAVEWACARVKDPQVLCASGALALDAIDDGRPEGAVLKTAALKVLDYLDKPSAGALVVSDFADMTLLFSADHANGDGVVPAALASDEALARAIAAIVETQGGVEDRSGDPGITAETLGAFFEQVQAVLDWRAQVSADPTILPLGEATAAAAAAADAVAAKIDDYFARCRLAAFDGQAAEALNPAPATYVALAGRAFSAEDEEVAGLPLATVEGGRRLPLCTGINPAWAARIARFREQAAEPLLGPRDALTLEDWQAVGTRLATWRAWMAARPETAVHMLDSAWLEQVAGDETRMRLESLIQRDLCAEASAATVDELERLARYQRDLVTLLRNFVTFSDFYGRQQKAIFQAGTLYLDRRSCELVLRVQDAAAHGALAPFSGCFLVYCTCERAGEPPLSIVAALTGGEADELLVPGRHGIFYDREGRDWRATVVKVIEQPVSVRQAFLAPYRRIGRFIEQQIQNFAAARDKEVDSRSQGGVTGAASSVGAGGAAPQAFDIAKFAGVFAAIGLAVGFIGTALTAAVAGLISLQWWQLPLVIAGILLVISAPSVVLAWLTLRRRSLGPLLDANGWAMNARARINIPFGGSLTGIAQLPAGANRSLNDPFAEKKRPWKTIVVALILLIAAVVLWHQGVIGLPNASG